MRVWISAFLTARVFSSRIRSSREWRSRRSSLSRVEIVDRSSITSSFAAEVAVSRSGRSSRTVASLSRSASRLSFSETEVFSRLSSSSVSRSARSFDSSISETVRSMSFSRFETSLRFSRVSRLASLKAVRAARLSTSAALNCSSACSRRVRASPSSERLFSTDSRKPEISVSVRVMVSVMLVCRSASSRRRSLRDPSWNSALACALSASMAAASTSDRSARFSVSRTPSSSTFSSSTTPDEIASSRSYSRTRSRAASSCSRRPSRAAEAVSPDASLPPYRMPRTSTHSPVREKTRYPSSRSRAAASACSAVGVTTQLCSNTRMSGR